MNRGLLLDKRGEKLLSIYWFFILGLTGVAIVGGTAMFYSSNVDARNLEANILMAEISDCLFDGGYIIDEYFDDDFDLISYCNFGDFGLRSDFYFNVEFNGKKIAKGNVDFQKQCEIVSVKDSGEKIEAESYPICVKSSQTLYYINNSEQASSVLKILAASNNRGRKISVAEQ